MLFLLRCFITVILFFGSGLVFAQGTAGVWEFHGEWGQYLPDQIDGVTEILPTLGLAVGWNKNQRSYSLRVIQGSQDDVTLRGYSLGMRRDLPASSVTLSYSLGIDLQGIERQGDGDMTYYGGIHAGGGVHALISSGLYFTSQMKLTAGPGVSLYLSLGLMYRPSED